MADRRRGTGPTGGSERPPPKGCINSGDLAIHIDRNGTWYHDGSPIRRKELVCVFASALSADREDRLRLVTPAEMGRFRVEDAPFIAVELIATELGRDQVSSFRIDVDEIVTSDPFHPIHVAMWPPTDESVPYVTVRPRIGARIARSVYYELVRRGVEETHGNKKVCGAWSAGTFFPIGRIT
ncbi:MAG: hypothetical protein A3J29_21500 [Acidobacteria bacterium RIFCSPLOWO2_12_FULL_67_14b]|nr:MAG: hypothetical protein A3J29_21500 [Acidobacteria bacterium RIFCSPLOWO2_12_FULL_67_14b]